MTIIYGTNDLLSVLEGQSLDRMTLQTWVTRWGKRDRREMCAEPSVDRWWADLQVRNIASITKLLLLIAHKTDKTAKVWPQCTTWFSSANRAVINTHMVIMELILALEMELC